MSDHLRNVRGLSSCHMHQMNKDQVSTLELCNRDRDTLVALWMRHFTSYQWRYMVQTCMYCPTSMLSVVCPLYRCLNVDTWAIECVKKEKPQLSNLYKTFPLLTNKEYLNLSHSLSLLVPTFPVPLSLPCGRGVRLPQALTCPPHLGRFIVSD